MFLSTILMETRDNSINSWKTNFKKWRPHVLMSFLISSIAVWTVLITFISTPISATFILCYHVYNAFSRHLCHRMLVFLNNGCWIFSIVTVESPGARRTRTIWDLRTLAKNKKMKETNNGITGSQGKSEFVFIRDKFDKTICLRQMRWRKLGLAKV